MSDWVAVYAEARVAFGDHPDARISTRDDDGPWGGMSITVHEWIGQETLAVCWRVSEEDLGIRPLLEAVARQGVMRWEWELAQREPREPFDAERLIRHAGVPNVPWHAATSSMPCEVRQEWGDEMAMRLEHDCVIVSPAAYRELLISQNERGRYIW